jgi:hypothetical protein
MITYLRIAVYYPFYLLYLSSHLIYRLHHRIDSPGGCSAPSLAREKIDSLEYDLTSSFLRLILRRRLQLDLTWPAKSQAI